MATNNNLPILSNEGGLSAYLNQIKKIDELNLNSRPSEIKPDIYYKITELCEKVN